MPSADDTLKPNEGEPRNDSDSSPNDLDGQDTIDSEWNASLQDTLEKTGNNKNVPASTNAINLPDEGLCTENPTQDLGGTQDFSYDVDATLSSPNPSPAQPGAKPSIPKMIGGYEVSRVLGRGGMGIVYKARQKKLGRQVALKMVLAGSHASVEQLERFISEAKAVAHLQHPNIVQIFEVGEHENLPFFSLEYVDGDSLDKILSGKPMPPDDAARLLETISRAMQYAHDHGVLHRDLKPANVLLTSSGVPKITDFGLAKRLEDSDDSSSTRTGTIMGTPSYMSPEQASGSVHQLGPATDQYSLGAMLYEFMTGRPPFLAAKAIDTILQVISTEPVPPRQLFAKLPVDLETICLKSLQKDPVKRYASCSELADDLRRFYLGEPILARPVGLAERAWRWCRRNPVVAGLSATASVAVIAVAIVSSWSAVAFSRKNAELATTNNALNSANDTLKKTNNDLVESNEEKERRSKRLQDYIQKVFTETNRLSIQENPKAKDYKNEILTSSLPIIDEIRSELPKGGQAEATMMNAIQQLGKFYADQDKIVEAEKARAMLVEMARGRIAVQEGSDKSRQNLVTCLGDLSDTRMELNRDLESCSSLLKEALAISESIVAEPKAAPSGMGKNPAYLSKWIVANSNFRLGSLLFRKGDSKQATVYFETTFKLANEILPTLVDGSAYENMPPSTVAMTEDRKRLELADIRDTIGRCELAMANVLYRTGEAERAEAIYREFIAKTASDVQLTSTNAMVLRKAIGAYGYWGEFLCQTERLEEGIAVLRDATQWSDQLLRMNSDSYELNRGAAVAYHRLAQWLMLENQTEAEKYGLKALEIRRAMAKADAKSDRRQIALMISEARFGDVNASLVIADRYLEMEHQDSEMLIEIAQALSQCSVRIGKTEHEESSSTSKQGSEMVEEKAFHAIEKAIKLGFQDVTFLKSDIDYQPLRSNPKFQSLLATSLITPMTQP